MKRVIKNVLKTCYKFYLENKISGCKGNMLIVFMYHNVAPYSRNNTVTPKDFEEGLLYLINKGFRNYSLNNLIERNFEFSGKGFVITIDDGEKDIINYCLPILKKYKLNATLFISPKLIGKSYGFSWKKIPKSIISFEEIEKYRGYKIEFMDEDDIKLWLENGLEIGSHGLRHIDLSSISLDSELLEEEILTSKIILEELIKIEIKAFCYPFGSFNDMVKDVVKRYYKCALTINRGLVSDFNTVDPYELPRITGANAFWLSYEIARAITKRLKKEKEGEKNRMYENK